MIAFLISANEAFGYTHDYTLDSSYSLIRAMLSEYSYMWNERNASSSDDGSGEVEGVDFEWVDLPDFDNPGQSKRYKKYKDVGKHSSI